MKKMSDIELLSLFESKRNEALEEIYQRYSSLVYGVCLKYLGSRDESLDAVVEIFESLIYKIPANTITNFNSWLYSVTKNHCLMKLRKEKSYNRIKSEVLFQRQEHAVVQEPDFALPTYPDLQQALCMLSSEQKECVTMFYYQEMSYAEISAATGFSVKSVKSYLQNGKIKLKKIMEERQNENLR